MKYILALLISSTIAFGWAQGENCNNLLGDALLHCMQQQAAQTTQALEANQAVLAANKAALEAANIRIAELEGAASGMQFYPHPCLNGVCQDGMAYEWRETVDKREVKRNISLQLEDTNAKYALATAFARMDLPENNIFDHVVHVFGTHLSFSDTYFYYSSGGVNPFTGRSNHGNYAAFVFNGDAAGNDKYGMHALLIIPLNEQQQMDAILADGHNSDNQLEHHIYLRVFGYLE